MSGGFADMLKSMENKSLSKLFSKVPSWSGHSLYVPSSLSYQQCSSEFTARYKASLISPGARVADLTGGLGVDTWAFSLGAAAVWYNERDTVLRQVVERNFAALGVSRAEFNSYDINPGRGDWQDALRSFRPDVVYLDPARRDASGKKLFLLEDCSPDVVALMPQLLEFAPLVMVKVSPMADITMLRRRLSPNLTAIHVLGSGGECKELLCVLEARAFASSESAVPDDVLIRLAEDSHVFQPSSVILSEAKNLLFVPGAAMVKSGLGPGLCKMPYDEHLSHFGKFYEIIEEMPFASSRLKELGRRYTQAEVTAKGLPLSSEELRAKIRTKPGGSVHIFGCTVSGARRILVCRLFG